MGNWQPTIYMLPSLVAFLITIWLAIRLWAERHVRGGMSFFVLVLALAVWSGLYTLEVIALDRSLKIFWAQAKYAGIVVTPVAWFFFTAAFAEKKWVNSPRLMLLLSMIPTVTGILALTNELHGIVWESGAQIITNAPFPAYVPAFNFYFWVHWVYSTGLFSIGLWFVVSQRRHQNARKRRQATIMFVGIGIAFVFNLISVVAANPLNNLDLSPVGFVIAGLSFAWVVLRLRLMDFMPAENSTPTFEIEADVQDILNKSRESTLTILVSGTLILGGIGILSKWIEVLRLSADWGEAILFTAFYGVVWALYMAKKLPFAIRATSFITIWYLFSLVSALTDGLELNMGLTLVAFCVFSFSLLGIYAGIFAILLSSITIGVVGLFLVSGLIMTQAQYVSGGNFVNIIIGLLIFALATLIATLTERRLQRDTQNLIAQSQQLSRQIEQHRALLEQRVAERSRILETSFTISRQISRLVNKDQIVNQVLTLIQETFDFYHVYIYLFDDQKAYLEAVGSAGKTTMQQKHRIPRGTGLIGQVAESNKTIRVSDVGAEPIWKTHQLLPETKSEIVVPISLGNDVLGVIGVQEQEGVNNKISFSDEATSLLESIASQVAFALQNANTYDNAQQQVQRETLFNQISQQIRQTGDRNKAIQVASRELGRSLKASQTIIQLRDRPIHEQK